MAEKSTMAQLDPEESSRDFQLETTLHEPAGNNEAMGTGPTNTGPTNTDPMNTGPTNTGPANTGPTNTGPANQRLTHAQPPVVLPDISQASVCSSR
ncbi:hypothetical protein DPMN_182157 [Dreissena polymorpha]|uniref:Uncharacterized protein n=1 Tax=Dreissena polymorpha TaxID=45954 RepID=A0A9D4I536_DREPO|nr:hypothetical protein DPMN_182157 [Dreissena polymorpha]